METSDYKKALEIASSLSPAERLNLIQELTAIVAKNSQSTKRHSILELRGLGKEIWQGIDTQKYIDDERSSWD